ncbi:hypothetical protein AGMMS49938_09250 [Fibrobacterales bacterium]|nr:hypothetical protein AGMMS49938_09250 [Fibrobacterales bacterium]
MCALYAAAYSPLPVLGPNVEAGVYSAFAPIEPRGAFIPQGNADFEFSWLEPLGEDRYGTWKVNKTRYLRFLAGAEISPFYATVRAGVGFAPLAAPFNILELRFIYENENLLWSDVEQSLMPNESPHITETWNGNYIFDQFYNKSKLSQIQSFSSEISAKYTAKTFEMSFSALFALIDIGSDYDKKSFDYMRGIPLHSRDYIVKSHLSATYHLGESLSLQAQIYNSFSGKRFKFFADNKFTNYSKEALSMYNIFAGLLWRFNGGNSYLSLEPGWFVRDGNKDSFHDSAADKFIIALQYRYFWSFNFGK